jgi:hypothetical protein
MLLNKLDGVGADGAVALDLELTNLYHALFGCTCGDKVTPT